MLQRFAQYKLVILVQGILLALILLISVDIATTPLRIKSIDLLKISHFSFHLIFLPLLLLYWPIRRLKLAAANTKHIYLIALLLSVLSGFVSASYTHTVSKPGTFLFQIHGEEYIDELGEPGTSLQITLSTSTSGYDYKTGQAMYFAEAFLHSLIYSLYALSYLQFYALTRKRKLRHQLKQQQLDILSHQLNPHFLFNSLNSIRGMLFEDPAEAKALLHEFRSLFKSHFTNKKHKITLHKEMELCQRYLKLEHVRFEERLRVNWQVADQLEVALVPSMGLFTLIENAIKHGIAQLMYGGQITVAVKHEQKHLEITVLNPIKPGCQADGTKTGLTNLNTRLKLLYEDDYKLATKTTDNEFKVTMSIPFKQELNHA